MGGGGLPHGPPAGDGAAAVLRGFKEGSGDGVWRSAEAEDLQGAIRASGVPADRIAAVHCLSPADPSKLVPIPDDAAFWRCAHQANKSLRQPLRVLVTLGSLPSRAGGRTPGALESENLRARLELVWELATHDHVPLRAMRSVAERFQGHGSRISLGGTQTICRDLASWGMLLDCAVIANVAGRPISIALDTSPLPRGKEHVGYI